MRYVFGDVELDPEQLELRRAGQRVALEPQAFDVLVHLVRHRDRVVAKEELMDQVWGGRFVSETAVTSRIKQVRRALGDDGQQQHHIRTHHGRGYRFLPDVTEQPAASEPLRPAGGSPSDHAEPAAERGAEGALPAERDAEAAPRPEMPVLTCGPADRPLRFQLSGQGPPDLLLLPAASSLDAEWDDPGRRALLDGLGAMARVIRCQRPGTTDADEAATGPASFDVPALLTVLDAAASQSAVVLAEDDGVVVATTLAATVPERVAGLVLFGAATADRTTSPPPRADATAAHDDGADVPDLGSVRAPTVVLHRVDDPVVPIGRGRALAARIPEAEFVALPGRDHAAHADPSQVLDAVAPLVGTVAAEQAADQHLTALVGLCGPDVSALVSVLQQLGGRLRQGPEHSVVVSFEGPASALKALGSRRARGLLGEAGIGLAIDEVPRDSFLVSGHGVDVARLFAEHAAPGEVLLPNVVRQLLAGSGLKVETLAPLDLPHVGPHPVHRWVAP